MFHAYPDCSGTVSFSPSSLACHCEAHMNFRLVFKYMVFSAPEAKKSTGYTADRERGENCTEAYTQGNVRQV